MGEKSPTFYFNIININIASMSLLDRKYTVFFNVINKEDRISKGVATSLFYTDEDYTVGQHFIHHYHKVECVVTKIRENQKS